MKFLIDENETLGIVGPLQTIYPDHKFEHIANTSMQGLKDIPLFEAMADAGFGALITQDRAQVEQNLHEVEALLAHGIHWIGRKQSKVPGRRGIAVATSSHVAAMPDLLDHMARAESPLMLRVLNVPHGASQRLKVQELTECRDRLRRRQVRSTAA